ncbi:hypothetical protein [Aeromonas sp. 102P]|uniref:F4 family fimbrial subunit n=1 Tax=Aeromonas sp. 102P TaxID=3452711 RepID=UPI003F794CFA
MKKTLIVAMVSQVLFAGVAHADEGWKEGPFDGKLDFAGVIVDKTPAWEWQIPTDSQEKAKKDFDVDVKEAYRSKDDDEKLVWDLAARGPLPFLQGRLTPLLSHGQVGVTPEITVAGNVVDWATPAMSITIDANGKTKSSGSDTQGQLSMIFHLGAATASYIPDVSGRPLLSQRYDSTSRESITAKNLTDLAAVQQKHPGVELNVSTGSSPYEVIADVSSQPAKISPRPLPPS